MGYKIIKASVNLLKNIGEIDSLKIKKLNEFFSKDILENTNVQSVPGVLILPLRQNKTIVLTNNQITYQLFSFEGIVANKKDAIKVIKEICDLFVIEPAGKISFEFEILADKSDSFRKTNKLISQFEKINNFKDYNISSGIKLILESELLLGEFRLEPFIKDGNYIYSTRISETKNSITIDDGCNKYYDQILNECKNTTLNIISEL